MSISIGASTFNFIAVMLKIDGLSERMGVSPSRARYFSWPLFLKISPSPVFSTFHCAHIPFFPF